MIRFRPTWILGIALLLPALSAAEETVGTFTLDATSYVSFGDRRILFPGAGSTIAFRFGAPNADGSVPFTIQPADVAIPPIPLVGGGTLTYTLAAPASGTLQPTATGKRVEFLATVRATLDGEEGWGSFDYTLPFTTETVSATSADGSDSAEVSGMRLVEGVWYGQIVGATTNRTNAFPEPGTAVSTVLSGTFDQVP